MADYLIDDSKLTALGDALREKEVVKTFVGEQVFYSKAFNEDGTATDYSDYYEGTSSDHSTTKYTIEGADYLEVTFKTRTGTSSYYNTIGFWHGDGRTTAPKMYYSTSSSELTSGFIYQGTVDKDVTERTIKITGSSLYFGFYVGGNQNGLGYWVDVKGYKNEPSTTKMTVDEMTQRIKNIDGRRLKTITIDTYDMSNTCLYVRLKDYIEDYSQIQSILMVPRTGSSSINSLVSSGGYFVKDLCWSGVTTKISYQYGAAPESDSNTSKNDYVFRQFAVFYNNYSSSTVNEGVDNIGKSPDEVSGSENAFAFLIDTQGRIHTPYYRYNSSLWKPQSGSYYRLYITYYVDKEEE